MTTFKVAVTQFELRPERGVSQLLGHMEALVREAAGNGAQLVVFPEFASTGLLCSITDHVVTTKTISSDYWTVLPAFTPEIVDGLVRMARAHDITILGGSHARVAEDGSLRNTAYLMRPDGTVQTQDKLHLTPHEHELGARGGDELLVTTIGPFTAGVLVCADIQFPELSRWLVGKGVSLILNPSLTWNRRGVNRVTIGCQARAAENQWYVVMSPLVGSDGLPEDAPIRTVGKALVTGPIDKNVGANDGIIAMTDADGEAILYTGLDPEVLKRSRERPEAPGLKLRRLDLFARLRQDVE